MKFLFAMAGSVLILAVVSFEAFPQCSPSSLLSGDQWADGTNLTYFYNPAYENVSGGGVAVDAAATTWNAAIKCFTFTSLGGLGTVSWIPTKAGWDNIHSNPDAGAITNTDFSSIFTTLLNGGYFTWDLTASSGNLCLQSVMTHEFGHILGLKHADPTYCPYSVMQPTISTGDSRTILDPADIIAVNSLCNNPAGKQISFITIFDNNSVEVRWKILSHNTDYYRLEKKLVGEEKFFPIAGAVFYPGQYPSNEYLYIDGEGTLNTIYRLVEIESSGNEIVQDIEQARLPRRQNHSYEPNMEQLLSGLEEWASMADVNRNVGMGSQTVTEDWVAIGPVEYIDSPGLLSIAYWHIQYGLTTGITILQHIQDYWDGDLMAYLEYLHDHGTRYIFLIGDASDYEYYDDPGIWAINGWEDSHGDWPSNPENDIVAADYYLDQEPREASMAFFTPYYSSDYPKSDIDNDGLPELIIGRLPVHDVDDMALYGAKAVKYMQNDGDTWKNDVSILINKWNVWGNDGSLAELYGNDLGNYFPAEFNKHIINNYITGCESYLFREALACNEFDEGRSVIVTVGTGSHLYDMNFWFEMYNGFTMSRLDDNNRFPFLLALSCGQADFDSAEDPELGKPICERLLFHDKKGVIGLFAPTRGSWQTGNYLIGKRVLNNLYKSGVPSLGYACSVALRDLILNEPQYSDLARSYTYLGDPAINLYGSLNTEKPPPYCEVSVDYYGDKDFIFPCPAGDGENMVAELEFQFNYSEPYDLAKEDITITYSPDANNLVIFGDDIFAVSDATSPDYSTTIQNGTFGGCGCDTIVVEYQERPVGATLLYVKTTDLNGSGKCDLSDFSIFGESYNEMMGQENYNDCCDYTNDEICNLSDFSLFAEHYLHEYVSNPESMMLSGSLLSNAKLVFEVNESIGVTGIINVTIKIENVENIVDMIAAIDFDHSSLDFIGWNNNEAISKEIIAIPISIENNPVIFIGCFGGEPIEESCIIGTLEFQRTRGLGKSVAWDDSEGFSIVCGELKDSENNIKIIMNGGTKNVSILPTADYLADSYPNPFNPFTTISYGIAQEAHVKLAIYNVAGQLIRVLVDEKQKSDHYKIIWDGKNNSGLPVASGVYFYRVKTQYFEQKKKMILLR